jgi:uncharacterized membrane protein YphA (DoxX/SURF4 family)
VKAWVGLVVRVTLAAVWLSAGVIKFRDAAGTVRAVRAYDLLPESLVPSFGHLLPVVEIVVGCLLLLGLLTRGSGAVSGLLLLMFIFGISSAWARGLQIQCGCFGGGGLKENATAGYVRDILRDIGLVALSAWLVWFPRTRLSLDGLLFRPLERSDDVEEGSAVQG